MQFALKKEVIYIFINLLILFNLYESNDFEIKLMFNIEKEYFIKLNIFFNIKK